MLFRAAPAEYGGSQARGQIWATAAGLHHRLWAAFCDLHYSSLQSLILNPLSEAMDQTHNFMVPGWICFHWQELILWLIFKCGWILKDWSWCVCECVCVCFSLYLYFCRVSMSFDQLMHVFISSALRILFTVCKKVWIESVGLLGIILVCSWVLLIY